MQAIQQQTVDLAVVGGAASAIHLLAELNCRIKQNRGNLPRTIAVVDPAVRPDGGSPH